MPDTTPSVPTEPESPTVLVPPANQEPKIETVSAPASAHPLLRPPPRDKKGKAIAKAPAAKPIEITIDSPEVGPFLAVEYIYQGPSGNHHRIVKKAGDPVPPPPNELYPRLIGAITLHPFETAAARDAALT